jgi:hypothetical protein
VTDETLLVNLFI